MRLFLSSYRAGRHNNKLVELLNGVKKVGVITNAKDYKTPEGRLARVGEVFDFFRSLGIEPTEIDLRPFFNKNGAKEELAKHKFIWLAGGNTFLLRRALQYSGADNFIVQNARDDSIIYGGESAGAIIVGPTLKGAEDNSTDEDNPNFIAEGYNKEIIWEGLNLVEWEPVPHYKSPDYGGLIDTYVKFLEEHGIPYKTIKEEQAIIINGNREEFLK